MNSKCKGGPLQHIQLIARYFNQEIIVNEVTDESVFVLCGQLIPEEEGEEEEEEKYLPMTIGIHKEPPSLITDLERQLKYMIYECTHCGAKFTQSCKLLYHATRCTNGQTKNSLSWREDLGARDPLRKNILYKG